MNLLSTKDIKIGDKCWRYSKLKHHRFRDVVYSITEKTIFRVHVSPGSAETLVRRGGITNNHSIVYSISNISAKKLKSVDVYW